MALTLRHGPTSHCHDCARMRMNAKIDPESTHVDAEKSLWGGEPGIASIFHPVSAEELERLARDHGAYVAHRSWAAGDGLGRDEVRWERVLVRLPDDGTGALPLLRHIILTDNKSSTYKLALLRVLTQIAHGVLGMVTAADDEFVQLPLGLVGLYWLRQFKPGLAANLPQMPRQRGLERLGFVRDAFRNLSDLSHLDLRVGTRFSGARAQDLHGAIKDAVANLVTMPIGHTVFPDGSRVFGTTRSAVRRVRLVTGLQLDAESLGSFGFLRVPAHVWRALTRFNVWVEPALTAEWTRLMQDTRGVWTCRSVRERSRRPCAGRTRSATPRLRATSPWISWRAAACAASGRTSRCGPRRSTSTIVSPGQRGLATICGTCCRRIGR